jgi:cytidyltransferase-like protein
MKKKIYNLNTLSQELSKLRKKKLKIVLCHGAFDLIHPGHLDHLNKAKKFGDILVVTITSDDFINKKLQKNLYNKNQRANFLANLEVVDYVSIIDDYTAILPLKLLKPDYYCKGVEYIKNDIVGNLEKEKEIISQNKIIIKYIGDPLFSSSKIISERFTKVDNQLKKQIVKNNVTKKDLVTSLEKISNLKVLMIGEMILDKYTNVTMMGVSPKASTLSCGINSSYFMPGGALATFHFVRQFVKKADFISIANNSFKRIKNVNIKNINNIIYEKNYPELIKERIIEKDKNGNLKKILTLNHFINKIINKDLEFKFYNKINQNIRKYDLVILQDFGHGLITEKIAKLIQSRSKVLSVNTQTNSLNYGFNIMGKKIFKADMFTLDRKELELAFGKLDLNFYDSLVSLSKKMKSKVGFLTCGEEFSLAYANKIMHQIRTFETKVVDTMGAGDVFHGMSSLMFCVQKNHFLSLLVAQIAGALAVKIEGNSNFPKINQIKNTFDFFLNSLAEENG